MEVVIHCLLLLDCIDDKMATSWHQHFSQSATSGRQAKAPCSFLPTPPSLRNFNIYPLSSLQEYDAPTHFCVSEQLSSSSFCCQALVGRLVRLASCAFVNRTLLMHSKSNDRRRRTTTWLSLRLFSSLLFFCEKLTDTERHSPSLPFLHSFKRRRRRS